MTELPVAETFEAITNFSYASALALPELRRRQSKWAGRRAKHCGTCGAIDCSAHFRFKQPSKGFLLALARRRVAKRGETNAMTEGEYAAKYAKLLDRFAAIAGKTYAIRGDDFQLADDEAWARAIDVINDIDPTAIDRNKNKRLSRG